ncbi:MAG: gliding motility-associated C-terminal domain-containing protein [bacterium]|nr:gliding motility-associated C-terminal domain-containing protein [bacterium]
MKRTPTIIISFLFITLGNYVFSQLETFQKEYETKYFTHCYDIASTPDGGYLLSGIQDMPTANPNNLTPYITKLDCQGEPEWTKRYAATSGLNNSGHKVAVISESEYVLLSSTGVTGTFNILVVKMDASGNTVWAKEYGGNSEDRPGDVIVLSDGNLAVVGSTKSFGANVGTPYSDIYALKINSATGDIMWSATFGITNATSDGYAVVENDLGGIAITGRVFESSTVATWAPIIQLDANGNYVSTTFYGMNDRNTMGLGLRRSEDGGYLLSGSSNILGVDWFDSRQYPHVIKTDASGGIVWGRVLEGTPNASGLGGIAYSPVDNGDTVAVVAETYHYVNVTQDPTKRILYLLDSGNGSLINARQYNLEGGQFPSMDYDLSGGYIVGAMTDEHIGSGPNDQWWNGPIVNKLDASFNSGCNETDRTSVTTAHSPTFTANTSIQFDIIGTGGNAVNLPAAADSFAVHLPVVETFCEAEHNVTSNLILPTLGCDGMVANFDANLSYGIFDITWDFGDNSGTITVPNNDTISHVYADTGSYFVQATVVMCDTTFTLSGTVITVPQDSDATITQIDDLCEDESLLLSAATSGGNWSGNGITDTVAGSFDAIQAGTGTHQIVYTLPGNCGDSDTIDVVVHPNPNADAGTDTTIVFGGEASLQYTGTSGQLSWSPSASLDCSTCESSIASPTQTTTYTVSVVDSNGCTNEAQVIVLVNNDANIFIPNIFSPNGDFDNDIFYVYGGQLQQVEFFIFDRWGEQVFFTDDILIGWDGNFKGQPAQSGVYVYRFSATDFEGNHLSFSGNITLVR